MVIKEEAILSFQLKVVNRTKDFTTMLYSDEKCHSTKCLLVKNNTLSIVEINQAIWEYHSKKRNGGQHIFFFKRQGSNKIREYLFHQDFLSRIDFMLQDHEKINMA